jgi:hypothetical protein
MTKRDKSNWFRRIVVGITALGVLGFGLAVPTSAFAANAVRPAPVANGI